MNIIFAILIAILLGIIISRLAALIGLKIFKFSYIYNLIYMHFKKSAGKSSLS